METLPKELIGCVLAHLSYRQRQASRLVSRTWCQVVADVENMRMTNKSLVEYDDQVRDALREGDLSLVRCWLASKPTDIGLKEHDHDPEFDDDDFPDDDKWHVLAFACKHCRNPAVVEALLSYAPDLLHQPIPGGTMSHYQDVSGGWLPLHVAACYGTPAIIKVLIKAGAKKDKGVYSCRMRNMTPLHIAARLWENNPLNVEANIITLIEAGASVTEGVVDGGKTALHSAVEKGAPLAVVKHLLACIRDGIYDYKGGPFYCFSDSLPIHLAMKNPGISLDVIKLLIESAPDTANQTARAYNTPYYPTPLHLACVFIPERSDVIEWLVCSGLVDVNAKLTGNGPGTDLFVVEDTALHILVRQDRADDHLIGIFKAAGASLDIANVKGETVRQMLGASHASKSHQPAGRAHAQSTSPLE